MREGAPSEAPEMNTRCSEDAFYSLTVGARVSVMRIFEETHICICSMLYKKPLYPAEHHRKYYATPSKHTIPGINITHSTLQHISNPTNSTPIRALLHLLLPLPLIMNLNINKRINRLRNQRKDNNPHTQRRPHILPVLRNIPVPPEKHAIRRVAADILRQPKYLISKWPVVYGEGKGKRYQISKECPAVS